MKKIVILVMMLASSCVLLAQKPIKPSLPKAEKAFREGKYEEAKSIIDATTSNQEFMVDKKGNPSKNAARAWYLKGVIYTGIDTTQNQAAKGLVENPLAIGMESFDKCYALDKGKQSYINDATGFIPQADTLTRQLYAQYYSAKAIKFYNVDKDYKHAFTEMEKVIYFIPFDTAQLMYTGVYYGPAAEEWDKSIVLINEYIKDGGMHPDAYTQLINIYYDKKKDKEKTLAAVKMARAKFPHNTEYPKYELNVYLTDKRYDLAKQLVREGLKGDPTKEAYYLLGGLYAETGVPDSAKIAFQKAVELDPEYFDAQFDLSKLLYLDAKAIKSERDKLGITPKDIQRRKVLFDELQVKYKAALPYWERCQKLSPDNETVLFTLSEIYTSLVMDEKAEVIRKKMKALGYLD